MLTPRRDIIRCRVTEDLVDRPAGFDDDRSGSADDARSGAEAGLLEAPRERLCEGLGTHVAAGLRARRECHQLATRPEPGPLDGLGGRLVAHGGREQLLERGVVEPAPRRTLVPEAHAVDRGGGRQPLHHQLVNRAPGLIALIQPARADPPARVVDARGDDFGSADVDDPRLPAAKARRRKRRDDAAIVPGRLSDNRRDAGPPGAQPPVERVEDAPPSAGQCNGGVHESFEGGAVGDELVELVDDAQPLRDLTSGPPLLPDDRSHVAIVAGSGAMILQL